MDSGSAKSIAPPSMATGVRVEASEMSSRGQSFIIAGDGRIPNQGQQILTITTNERRTGKTCCQIGEVHRPLTSITQTCDAGNHVIFTSDGGYVYSLTDGSYIRFERHSNIYELDLWLKADDANGDVGQPGFAQPGY